MASKAPGIWSLVLVPAVVSLIVTILRLVGELNGWNDSLFSHVAPGGESKSGLIGISWLMPIFGFWFGFKLRRATGEPPKVGKAALRFAIGAVVLIGGFMALVAVGLIELPSEESPGEPTGLAYGLIVVALAAIVMFTAWTRLAKALVLYALLARIPVVAVTWLALQNDWQTYYVKLQPGTVLPADTSPFVILAMPQVTFWIVTTLLIGGLFGCLGARLAGRGSK